MREWSSDVCSSVLALQRAVGGLGDLHDRLHLAGFVVDGLPAAGGGLLGNRNQRQQCQRKQGGSEYEHGLSRGCDVDSVATLVCGRGCVITQSACVWRDSRPKTFSLRSKREPVTRIPRRLGDQFAFSSAERRVGKVGVSTWRSRWVRANKKKKKQ